MLFDTRSLGMMRSSLEGLSVQQQVILHNLANLDTPGYKAKSSGGRRSLGRLVQHIAKVGEVAADLLVKVQLADVVLVEV